MELLKISLESPWENLALEEALLDEVEFSRRGPLLRIWESRSLFVVMGAGSPLLEDVNVPACKTDSVPILRRASGGGTVLQGPGCLNFSFFLHKDSSPRLNSISGANQYILSSVMEALGALGWECRISGTSDLVCGERKFSGSAQRRKKNAVLLHGTILYDFNLELISRHLREPAKRPEYRAERTHAEFVRNLPLSPNDIEQALIKRWDAIPSFEPVPMDSVRQLVETKYSREEWTNSITGKAAI